MGTTEINMGQIVVCDSCNDSSEETMGGGGVGSYSYCPKCFEKRKGVPGARAYDPNMTFADNVRIERIKNNGSPDAIITIRTGNAFLDALLEGAGFFDK